MLISVVPGCGGLLVLTYLEDIRSRAGDATGDALDEARHFGHDIYAVQAVAERTVKLCADVLGLLGSPFPRPLDRGRRRPLALLVLFGRRVAGQVCRAGVDDLAVFDDAADVHHGGSVRGRRGVFHHDGRVRRALEVDKVPPRG